MKIQQPLFAKHFITFSSYYLTTEEEKALSFDLGEHISTGLNHNKLFTSYL